MNCCIPLVFNKGSTLNLLTVNKTRTDREQILEELIARLWNAWDLSLPHRTKTPTS